MTDAGAAAAAPLSGSEQEEHNAMLLLLKGDLDLFFDHLRLLEDTAQATAKEEIQLYQEEAEKLRAAANHERELISQRKEELYAAQKTRQNRLQYDEIARKIVVYPSRDVMEINLQQLQERAATLQKDNEAYAKVGDETRKGLESIVGQLRTLSQSIEASVGDQAPATTTEASEKATPLNPQVAEFTPQSQAGGESSVPRKRSYPTDSDTNPT
ncbi:hypothetical protein MBRA1_002059 [Malassezia brasiliensis]|uniref:Uncharacterized protein n=1 Tax=Malassezia brasiliensis TaxID=1821822 RepID=A0AAF0DV83_9BASI|nr:hypothetical protein MBRA1_002059 [Malassezia brasiliensis]